MRASDQLEAKIAELSALTREGLAERWAAAYGCPPPLGMRKQTLLYAAAWHLQAKQLGGFSPETRRLLKRAVQDVERRCMQRKGIDAAPADTEPSAQPRRTLSPGARLIREWNGHNHMVEVTTKGFLFNGKDYRSLSAIAREITGAHWSGPRFFGL